MTCPLCIAAGLLPECYTPRTRKCAFPNSGLFIPGGGWGCPTEDMLCEILRNDDASCLQRFYLGEDAHASLLMARDDEDLPTGIWATWYKSRGYFEQLVALGWSDDDHPKSLSFAQAAAVIRRSHVKTFHDDLRKLL